MTEQDVSIIKNILCFIGIQATLILVGVTIAVGLLVNISAAMKKGQSE